MFSSRLPLKKKLESISFRRKITLERKTEMQEEIEKSEVSM
jgi:hypothetical protein